MSDQDIITQLTTRIEQLERRIASLESQPIPYTYQNGKLGINGSATTTFEVFGSGTAFLSPTWTKVLPNDSWIFHAATGSVLNFQLLGNKGYATNLSYSNQDDRNIGVIQYVHDGSSGLVFYTSGTQRLQLTEVGELRAGNLARLNGVTSAGALQMRQVTVNTGTVGQLLPVTGNGTGTVGVAMLFQNGNASAIFATAGSSNITAEISDPFTVYSAASGTANSVNIYWDGTKYAIQNNRPNSLNFSILFFGNG